MNNIMTDEEFDIRRYNLFQTKIENLPDQNKVRMFDKYYGYSGYRDNNKVQYINEHLVRDMDKWYKTKSKY